MENNPASWELLRLEKESQKHLMVILPHTGKLITDFAKESIVHLKDKQIIFFRETDKSIVQIKEVADKKTGIINTLIDTVDFTKLGMILEEVMLPGVVNEPKELSPFDIYMKSMLGSEVAFFKEKSVSKDVLRSLSVCDSFTKELPRLNTLLLIPQPYFMCGRKDILLTPMTGYDHALCSYLPKDAPQITTMDTEKAKSILYDLVSDFCFKDQIVDRDMAIAAIITPMCRYLYSRSTCRTPMFLYMGNRPRCGKDYLAMIRTLLYEGISAEEPPLSTEDRFANPAEELRKKLQMHFKQCRKSFHSSNNRGYLSNAVLEMCLTMEHYSDRTLGTNDGSRWPNELEFSMSANIGLTFTDDFRNRCRLINLSFSEENANSRKFRRPDLHGYVIEKRGLILSAIYSLIFHWVQAGCPSNAKPFSSYPEWSRVVGGICVHHGIADPCVEMISEDLIGGDTETLSMREMFEHIYSVMTKQQPKMEKITKKAMVQYIKARMEADDESYTNFRNLYDMDTKQGQTLFGLALRKHTDRIHSSIKMRCLRTRDNSLSEYVFSKQEVLF